MAAFQPEGAAGRGRDALRGPRRIPDPGADSVDARVVREATFEHQQLTPAGVVEGVDPIVSWLKSSSKMRCATPIVIGFAATGFVIAFLTEWALLFSRSVSPLQAGRTAAERSGWPGACDDT